MIIIHRAKSCFIIHVSLYVSLSPLLIIRWGSFNLTAIKLIEWDFPSVLNTNICGGLAAKLDELEAIFSQNSANVACIFFY